MCQVNKGLGSMYLTMQELILTVAAPWVFFASLFIVAFEGVFIFFRYRAKGIYPFDRSVVAFSNGNSTANSTSATMNHFELSYLIFSDPPSFDDLPEELNSDVAWSVFGWTCVVFYLLLSTIVLVNILVAAMTHSYETLCNELLERSAAIRVQMIKKFKSRRALPPPLNLLPFTFEMLLFACGQTKLAQWFETRNKRNRRKEVADHQRAQGKWTNQRVTNTLHNLKDAVRRYEERHEQKPESEQKALMHALREATKAADLVAFERRLNARLGATGARAGRQAIHGT
eukprot:g802.t1